MEWACTSEKLQLLAGGRPLAFNWGSVPLQGNPQNLSGGIIIILLKIPMSKTSLIICKFVFFKAFTFYSKQLHISRGLYLLYGSDKFNEYKWITVLNPPLRRTTKTCKKLSVGQSKTGQER